MKTKQTGKMKHIIDITRTKVLILVIFSSMILTDSCEIANELTGAAATIAKIEGDWSCDEQSEYYKATAEVYAVTISPDPDHSSGIIIYNFYGIGANITVRANISGMTVTIPNQTVDNDFDISGSGTISSNYKQIDLNYTVDDGSSQVDHVTAVYTK
jgi:hypothetical protein